MKQIVERVLYIVSMLLCLTACSKYSTDNNTLPNTSTINVKDFGAKGDGHTNDDSSIAIALQAAHDKNLPLFFPPGKYLARIQLPHDNLTILGSKANGRFFDSAGTVIMGIIDCNFKKHIRISNLGIDSRGLLLSSDDAALTSGAGAGNQPLDHTFSNIALLGGGYNDLKHGILCFAGSGIRMNNIYVSSFYHGIAIRCSDVAIEGVSADYCGFTSVVIKSAGPLNELVQNVSAKNISIHGDPNDVFRRGGTVLVMSYNNISLTQNIMVDSVFSANGGVGAVNIQQDSGQVKNVSIANCYALNCGDANIRAAYDISGGTNITYSNCKTANSFGIGFRSANNPVNLQVRSSFASGSAIKDWMGSYQYLQLNGLEIIK